VIDLDAVQAAYEQARQAAWRGDLKRVVDMAQTHIPALVAELRAAREVVARLPPTSTLNLIANGWDDGAMRRQLYDVADARDAYDKVVGS
jgi:hypothetical protein